MENVLDHLGFFACGYLHGEVVEELAGELLMTSREILDWGTAFCRVRPFTFEQRAAVNEVIANLYTTARLLENYEEKDCPCDDAAKQTDAMRMERD